MPTLLRCYLRPSALLHPPLSFLPLIIIILLIPSAYILFQMSDEQKLAFPLHQIVSDSGKIFLDSIEDYTFSSSPHDSLPSAQHVKDELTKTLNVEKGFKAARSEEDSHFPCVHDYIDLYTPAEMKMNEKRRRLGLDLLKPAAAMKSGLAIPPREGSLAFKRNERLKRRVIPNGGEDDFKYMFASSRQSTGHIAIYLSQSQDFMGYLNANSIVQHKSNASTYQFASSSNRNVSEIIVPSTDRKLAVSVGLFGQTLSPESKAFHMPRETHMHTNANEPPTHNQSTGELYQTTVFSVDNETNQINIHWMNPDGSFPNVHVMQYAGYIYFTGDPDEFRQLVDHHDDDDDHHDNRRMKKRREYVGGQDVASVVLKWAF